MPGDVASVSEPSSTTAIIEQAVAAADFSDAGNDPTDVATLGTPAETETSEESPAADAVVAATETPAAGDKPVTDGEKPAEPDAASKEAAEKAAEEAEIKAAEKELLAKNPGMKNGRISVSRHQTILERQRRVANEKVAAAEKQFAEVKHLATPETKERLQAVILAEHNPKVFFGDVLLQDPRYRALVDQHVESEIGKRGLKAAPAVDEGPKEAPAPDTLLPDGTLGYTAETLQKVIQFHLSEASKKHRDEIDALRKDITPFTEERKGRENFEQAVARQRTVLANARARWNGFSDHEKDIAAEMRKPGNERMTLEQAYDAVVPAKLQAAADKQKVDRAALEEEIRQKVIKSMNDKTNAGASVATSQARVAAKAVENDDTPRDTGALIRASMRAAGL
jgi:hypothetical protein